MTLVVGNNLNTSTSLNTVHIHKLNVPYDTSSLVTNLPNTRICCAEI